MAAPLAADHVAAMSVILGQLRSVVSAMRTNAKWALTDQRSELSHTPPDPLTESFRLLRKELHTWRDLAAVPPLAYLTPFLGVCRSEAASGPITGAALRSIYTIISAGLVQPDAPGAVEAMHAVVDAVAHCRFEATDPAHDDTVLALIMSVLLAALRCTAGHLLSDDHVCAVVHATYHIGHHTGRESVLLVHMSMDILTEVVRTVFARIKALSALQESSSGELATLASSMTSRSTGQYGECCLFPVLAHQTTQAVWWEPVLWVLTKATPSALPGRVVGRLRHLLLHLVAYRRRRRTARR